MLLSNTIPVVLERGSPYLLHHLDGSNLDSYDVIEHPRIKGFYQRVKSLVQSGCIAKRGDRHYLTTVQPLNVGLHSITVKQDIDPIALVDMHTPKDYIYA
jgi:hypothetical protein